MNIKIIKKKIKNINLKVKPTGEVILSVPLFTPNYYIDEIIEKKSNWIEKKLDYFKKNHRPKHEKQYIESEIFSYLGQDYKLKIIKSDVDKAELDVNLLKVYVKDESIKQIIDKWYLKNAKDVFNQLITKYQKIVKKDIKRVTIKKMKTRWGSCNHTKQYINLNLHLIEKSLYAIEYVILHELAHLIFPNHSKEFYNYIERYMPDWKERKKQLI